MATIIDNIKNIFVTEKKETQKKEAPVIYYNNLGTKKPYPDITNSN